MYENIKNAMQGGKTLTPQEQAQNYDLFGKMMKEGVSLADLVKKVDALETEVKDLKKPKQSAMDAQLFYVMEQAVKGDPAVTDARRRLQDEKTRIISDLCMADEVFRKLYESYRTAVNSAYVNQKEGKTE